MTVEWWELLVLAGSCTFAGWTAARRLRQVKVIDHYPVPIPLEQFTAWNIHQGDTLKCPECARPSVVTNVDLRPLKAACGGCHREFIIHGFDEVRQAMRTGKA